MIKPNRQWLLLTFAGLCISASSLQAAETEFVVSAISAESPPTIDGKLDDPVWESAPTVSDFIQFTPVNGAPSSLKTVAKFLYDDKYVYIGFLNQDPAPNMIQPGTGKRDGLSSQTGTDSVTVMLDTFDDDQTAYYFRTNVQGVQHDGRLSDNGRTPDDQWDGVWVSAGALVEEGWSAEIAIPLETVMFQPGENRTWGAQFSRYLPRNREQSFWTGPLENYRRVDSFGELRGLNLQRATKKLDLIPHAISRIEDNANDGFSGGLDVRYSISQLASGQVTANPDFATVEADQEQINLTRFELSLPEKRFFFLEDNQMYQQRIRLFYSRRITDIWGGAKVYGKSGGFEYSGMSVQTKEDDELPLGTSNFTVARLKRDVLSSSTIGLTAANKNLGGMNRGTVGTDTALYFTDTFRFTGQLAGSYGSGLPSDIAYFLRPSYDTATFHAHIRHTYIGPSFGDAVNAVGFIHDDDRRELDSAITKAFWFEEGFLERIDYQSNYNIYWGVKGPLRSWDVYQSLTFDLRNRLSFMTRWDREFKLFEKEFDNDGLTFEVGYNTREWQQVRVAYQFGKNFDSDFKLWTGLVRHNLTKDLSVQYELSHLTLDPDPGLESTWIHVVRGTQAFTKDFFISLFYQANTSIKKSNVQALLVYRFQPPFGLVQVAYQKGTGEFGEVGKQGHTLFLKFAYVI